MSILERLRLVPPPEPPDLLRESGERAVQAAWATTELGPNTTVAGIWRELAATRDLPDPYGPDPVVFGPGPEGERC